MNGPDVPSSGTPPTGGDPGYDAVIEDILAGRLGHEPEDEMSLVGLVDALRAPGSDEELGDVEAATSAFLAARSGAGAEAGSGVVVPLAPRRAGRAVVAVAAVLGAVVLVGGTAAAANGSLPRPLQDAVHRIIPAFPSADEADAKAQAEQLSTSTSGSATTASVPSTGAAGALPGTSTTPGSSAGPPLSTSSPQVAGLCRAFADKSASQAARSRARQALEKLATAEGKSVIAFCAPYLAAGNGNGNNGNPSGNNGNANGASNGNGNNGANGNGNNANNGNANGASNGNGTGNGNGNGAANGIGNGATKSPGNGNGNGNGASNGNGATKGAGNGKPSTTP